MTASAAGVPVPPPPSRRIRTFDTAPHYGLGLSERRLGDALRCRPRDEYVISTKVGRLLEPAVSRPDGRRLAQTCARYGVPLRAAAARFPLTHPAVASVLIGVRSAAEAADALALRAVDIPAGLWDSLATADERGRP